MDENLLWTAIQKRDSNKDGHFYYGVTSTGVFCRPSCPSRRPRRDRVLFFADSKAAQAAGFRPCLRCRPLETPLEGVADYIHAHLDEKLTLQVLARVAGLSTAHFQKRFTKQYGMSPAEYIRAHRAERLKSGLREGSSVTDSMLDAGYGSTSRLYEHGAAALAMTPREYQAAGRGLEIRYAVFETALGWTAAAATERGLCRVAFGDNIEGLERDLQGEFSNAFLVRGELPEYVAAIRSLAVGERNAARLPLDVRGTAFQFRVWRELQAIPPGETRSYRDVATAIGNPAATRAVARACATNPVAVVVPCHRVVRTGGELGGYRWGLTRKRRLLAAEFRAPSGE
jgi:AraC family transcriptional regulator of adaptative response/methylated-DNA-[protein]-cysteine methyltransferase